MEKISCKVIKRIRILHFKNAKKKTKIILLVQRRKITSILIDSEKSLTQIQYPYMMEALGKLGIERDFLR